MDREEALQIQRNLDRLACDQSLRKFVVAYWPFVEPARKFVPGWALDAICDHLEAVTYGHIKQLLMNVPPGFMKGCSDLTPVLTPKGYVTHGDLKPGDEVFAPDGTPAHIVSISPDLVCDHEVTFSTHETIKCNGDHLWRVYDRYYHGWITRDTRYLAAAATEKNRNRFFIPDTGALQFPERDLPLHPYFLGCWLGDGCNSMPRITHAASDTQHIEKLAVLGYVETSRYAVGATIHSGFYHQGVMATVRALGLYKNKHIPMDYMLASESQRMELLAGLVDTDGTVDRNRGRVMIGTCDDALAEQIKDLVNGLGMRAYETTLPAPGYGAYKSDKIYHMIGFQPDRPLPTAIPRKQVQRFDFARRLRAITSVKRSENPEVGHCIRIDRPDGLYVVGRTNLVTHNSLTTDVFWPAWEWGPRKMPSMRYLCFSYSEDLTIRDNERFRNIIMSERYRADYGNIVQPSRDTFNKIKIANKQTGWKLASSVSGVGTGERGDRLIIDDPNSVKQAESEAVRGGTNQWFREVVPTRLNDARESAIIVIQQRTHEEDVSGVILAEDLGYEHLMIPMEYDPGRHCVTVIKRDKNGEPLQPWQDPRGLDDHFQPLPPEEVEGMLAWPERFPDDVVAKLKRTLGPYATAGQLQQIPAPRGGGIFKREWWEPWPPLDWPAEERLMKEWPEFEYVVASLDSAFTSKKENDYNALTIWGIWRGATGEPYLPPRVILDANGLMRLEDSERPRIMLMHGWHKQLTLHGPPEQRPNGLTDAEWSGPAYAALRRQNWGVVEWVIDSCRRFKVHALLIEAKASGLDVANELARLYTSEPWSIQMINPKGDKVARAYAVQNLFANGQVYCPMYPDTGTPRDWAQPIIDEMASFPKAAHDDFVDSATMALLHLREIGLAVRREEAKEEFEDSMRERGRAPPLYPV